MLVSPDARQLRQSVQCIGLRRCIASIGLVAEQDESAAARYGNNELEQETKG